MAFTKAYRPKGLGAHSRRPQRPRRNGGRSILPMSPSWSTPARYVVSLCRESFADLLNPIYKGMIVYDDPRFNGTGFYTSP